MERYENNIGVKDSTVEKSFDSIHNSRNEKRSENDHCVSSMSFSSISYHKEEVGKSIFAPEKTLSSFDTFIMPNELYFSFSSDSSKDSKMLSKNDRLESLSMGHSSTPASPEETERARGKLAKRDIPSFNSPISEKKMSFSYTSGFVRTSKSEDHLQKSSLTTVNIDIEDEMASSLNTLLDTKQDDSYGDLDDKVDFSNSSPVINFERAQSPDILQSSESSKSEVSPSSSETTSPSKISVRLTEVTDDRQSSDKQSESSGSEMIPSDSSATIRRDDSECSEGECTSEQISAISSLDDGDPSRATDSDIGSPEGSLSPAIEFHQGEEWFCEMDRKEIIVNGVSDFLKNSVSNKTKQVPPNVQLHLLNETAETTVLQSLSGERTPSQSSSFSVPKIDGDNEKVEISIESPTSLCSEDTFGDVSYHELTESYDESSVADVEDDSVRSESPPTDDESDIESLHSFHYSPKAVDLPSASRLAKRLYNLDGFKKTDVSRHLCKNNEFSRAVAEEYLKFFDFTGDTLDVALRKFLSQFCLIGETQERERVLVHFSKHFLDCNPGSFRSQDAVHTLTCALMMLNSDLHGENVCRKMVCGEFIENLSELNDGDNFPREVLKALYGSIKSHPLEWAVDAVEEKKSNGDGSNASLTENRPSYIGHNPFLEVPNPNCATEYKKGYVMRKCCIDPSGKKTPLGRRSWKMLYATLRDLVLYLHKDEHGFRKNQLYDSLHNSIRIHHAFATKAADYTKKQFVFRLHTADQAVYLFQTSDSKELDSWVNTINLVAASLSASPLASAVGNQRKFQRPLLPVSHTKLNLHDQLQDHENRIVWLEKELEEHLNKTPERKSRFIQEYLEKEAHLQNELTRYRTYAFLLRTRMSQYPELETPLVQTSIGEVEEPIERGKSSSSPTSSPSNSQTKRTTSAAPEKPADKSPSRTEEHR